MSHKVTINVSKGGGSQEVIRSKQTSIRSRILNLLLGMPVGLMVITPGETVETVEIKEMKGEARHGQNENL